MGSVDYCEDLNEVLEIRRTKVELNVADLSVHSNDYKYRLYQWNLIPIAIFYALPVIQLVAGVFPQLNNLKKYTEYEKKEKNEKAVKTEKSNATANFKCGYGFFDLY